jgi:hypothetical protein
MIFPFGYIDKFDGYSLSTANIKPLRCRLRGPNTARILNLVNGAALNVDGSSGSPGQYPVEQILEIMIHGNVAGGGLLIDTILNQIAAKQGGQGVLQIHVPGHWENYYCEAIFDYPEIVNEGKMADLGIVNWVIVKLVFQQLAGFY